MNVEDINTIIQELQDSEITPSNTRFLASLYIIKDKMEKPVTRHDNTSNKELQDVLPAFNHYVDVKRKYQMQQISDDALVQSMKFVVQELREFIQTLYCNTSTRKERIQIESMLTELISQFTN